MQKLKETGDSRCIYQNEPVKDLTRRIASDKILSDKHLILLKIQNLIDVKGVLLQWFIHFW